jgi:molybdate transport system ATP-binding protein
MTLDVHLRGSARGLTFDVDLQVGPAPLALVGPSGAGKSTVVLAILGLVESLDGHVALDGITLQDTGTGIALPTEHRLLGYVPQGYGLFAHLDVLDNIAFGLGCGVRPLPRRDRRERARALAAQLGIEALQTRTPRQLSGGEAQRVALARALAVQPRALLLDEPLAALDTVTRAEVRQWLHKTLDTLGIPTIVVTHDPVDALDLADRFAVLEAGRVVQQGSAQDLAQAPATAFVRKWLEALGRHEG